MIKFLSGLIIEFHYNIMKTNYIYLMNYMHIIYSLFIVILEITVHYLITFLKVI